MAAALVLGVLKAATTIASFATKSSDFFKSDDGASTGVRIGIGSLKESASSGGNHPGVALFDVWGKRIGHANGSSDKVKNGGQVDIKVEHYDDVGNPQAQYVAISNGGDDAICIAYITMSWPNGDEKAWYGDIGKECDSDWYHSQTIVGEDQHMPKCVWVDRDGSDGLRHQGFGMHITDFQATDERSDQYNEHRDTMCSRPRFHSYKKLRTEDDIYFFDPPLEYEPETLTDVDFDKVLVDGAIGGDGNHPEGEEKKRSLTSRSNKRFTPEQIKERARFMDDVLVMSESDQHSAKQLCLSESSAGPDFVSFKEKVYCDMSEKEVWPLCEDEKSTACFDTEAEGMRGGGLGARDETSGRVIPSKSYSTKQHWK